MRRVGTEDGLYKIGDPANGVKGTPVTDFFNDVQEELSNVIEAVGIALDGNQRNQLLQAIYIISGASHIRTMAGSGAVLAADRFISVDASAGDVALTLPAANSALARRLELHREDATANKVTLLAVAGTIARTEEAIEVLGVQDEVLILMPNAATNNWIRI